VATAAEFVAMEIEDQRKLFSTKDREVKRQLEGYIRAICDIIRNIVSDAKLVKYFILLLDGMIEGSDPLSTHFPSIDDRDRLSILIGLQKASKSNKEDIIDMLKQYYCLLAKTNPAP
jgi:hypothetical protein